jgi:transcriptional regulator with XRE-family HTH domain
MTDMKKYSGPSREWLIQMADFEDACQSVSVGGLAGDLDMLPAFAGDAQRVFGRLIELARRKKSLTVEQLAEQADVDLAEIVDIETQEPVIPHVRTVYQLAQVLDLPSGRLMEVAGLAKPRPEINSAALKFAARSESTAKLTREEKEALEEFVKVLVEASDGG